MKIDKSSQKIPETGWRNSVEAIWSPKLTLEDRQDLENALWEELWAQKTLEMGHGQQENPWTQQLKATETLKFFIMAHKCFKMRIGRKRSIWEPHNQAEIDGKHQKNALKLVPRQTFEVLCPNSFEAMEKWVFKGILVCFWTFRCAQQLGRATIAFFSLWNVRKAFEKPKTDGN